MYTATGRRRLAVFAAALALSTVALSGAPSKGKLSNRALQLLAQARANGDRTVVLLIASDPTANSAVASGLTGLGATVRYQDDALGYLRVIIATDRVEAAAAVPGVQLVDLDEIVPLEDPRPQTEDDAVAVGPPNGSTPPENPAMPTRDIGAPQFVAANPTFDGRGVKIAIVDSGVDVLRPELQSARLIDGTPTRKIVDWVNAMDPLPGTDPSWVNMATQVFAVGGSFTTGGQAYTNVPADGQFRFGMFKEADIGISSDYGPAVGATCNGSDLNRNGVCGQSFALLWRTSDDTVWVDTNADRSFAGEQAMHNYRIAFDIGQFGVDNPATAIQELVPFVVQTDGKNKYVNIGIVSSAHGTHVAGIAAGKGFFGGAFNGTAPEAQIVSVRVCFFGSGCSSAAILEGIVYAAKQSGADVVNMSIGGLPDLNDGNNARSLLFNRLIDQTKTQLFFSAGNSGPGINTVGDPSVATKVMSVGAYVHKDTWLDNYGATAAKDDGLFVFSSRGPREDGGFKPNIVASGSAVSTIPAWQRSFPLVGPLPPGYDMFNGTSMSSPQATGGAALLISAAKQRAVQYRPEQLRAAISQSARYLPAYGAHEQGAGLFQVGAAWDVLRTNLQVSEISSVAPVNTVLGSFLAAPFSGPGIYEREGWPAGTTRTRAIQFTREKGTSGAVRYAIEWIPANGAFSSASSIDLRRGVPASLPVTVTTPAAGVHSAILSLRNTSTGVVDYQVLNTVVATQAFSPANNFSISYAGSADRPDKASFYFSVAPNTPAFKVDITDVLGRVRFLRYRPVGSPFDNTNTTPYQTGGTQSRTVANPSPGVWEVTVDTSRTSTVSPSSFTVTGSVLGVAISPTSWTVDPAAVGTTYSQAFTFTNNFGAFTGGAVGTALSSAFAARPTIADGGPDQVFDVAVPAGSTNITARISGASDPAADLDLYLFDCTTGTCVLRSAGTGATANETVSFNNPAAGAWKVVVNAFSVPAGSTAYDYIDVFANPAFGLVSVNDPAVLRAPGASWSATADATANTAPAVGRFLQGFVQVRSGSTLLGSAQVRLLNFAPPPTP